MRSPERKIIMLLRSSIVYLVTWSPLQEVDAIKSNVWTRWLPTIWEFWLLIDNYDIRGHDYRDDYGFNHDIVGYNYRSYLCFATESFRKHNRIHCLHIWIIILIKQLTFTFHIYGFDHIIYFITSNLWEESVLKNLLCLFSRLKISVIFTYITGKEDYYCTERSEWDLIMCILYDEHIIGSSRTRLYLCKHTIYILWLC